MPSPSMPLDGCSDVSQSMGCCGRRCFAICGDVLHSHIHSLNHVHSACKCPSLSMWLGRLDLPKLKNLFCGEDETWSIQT